MTQETFLWIAGVGIPAMVVAMFYIVWSLKRQEGMRDEIRDLWKWHNVSDNEGVKIWYVRKSLEEAIEKLASNIEMQTEILRSMIDRIEIATAPNQPASSGNRYAGSVEQRCQQPSDLTVTLYGQLAAIVGLAEEEEAIENKQRFSLVAGARNHRELTLPPVAI